MLEELIKKFKENMFHTSEYELTEEELKKKEFFEKNILNSKQFGDYVWAIKDDTMVDEKDARMCPYIVIGKTDDKLIACRVTKNPTKTYSFKINKNDPKNEAYLLYTDIKTIDYASYRHCKVYFGASLTEEEQKMLKDKFSSLGNNIFYKDFGASKEIVMEIEQDFKVGDVIVSPNGIPALIIDNDEKGYLCINLDSFDNNNGCINFNEENFNFSERFYLYKRNYNYLGKLPSNQLLVVINKYSNFIKTLNEYQKLKEDGKLTRGAIIKRMNKIYYVNTIESRKAKLFLLEQSNENDDDALCFGGLYFKPHYDETYEIDENDVFFKPIRVANEAEMELVKKDKKNKSKTKKQTEKSKTKPKKQLELTDGDIVEHDLYFKTKFLILGFYDDTIIAVSLHSIEDGTYRVFEFNENDNAIHMCNDITINDRATIEYNQNYLDGLFEDICDKKDEREIKLTR